MTIQVVHTPTDIAKCLLIRAEVFIDEQKVTEDDERDGLDDQCVHFLATDGPEVVGAARLNHLNEGYAKIQRVCVKKTSRGDGIGAGIIRAMIEHVRNDGERSIIRLGAQTHAISFYETLGFAVFGEEYMDAGIPHFDMELKL